MTHYINTTQWEGLVLIILSGQLYIEDKTIKCFAKVTHKAQIDRLQLVAIKVVSFCNKNNFDNIWRQLLIFTTDTFMLIIPLSEESKLYDGVV